MERLARLKEFLADPETAGLLREIIEGAIKERSKVIPTHEILPSNIVRRGSVIAAAYRATVTFPSTFTATDIQKRMMELGFRFTAAHPIIAVNSAMRKLTERRAIRIVRKGSGRRPNLYENIGRQIEGRQIEQEQ